MDIAMKAYETCRGIFQAFFSFLESIFKRLGIIDADGWID